MMSSPSDTGVPSARLNAAACALLFLLSAGLYINSLGNGFVWDDFDLVVNAANIRPPLDPRGIFTDTPHDIYRPFRTLVYAAAYRIGGAEPAAFHAVNVLLHAAVCALLYVMLLRVFGDFRPAATAAALFAAHPVHSEAVAYISGLADVLAAALLLASLLCFSGGDDRRSRVLRAAGYVLYLLALLSKELAVVFPAILLLYDTVVLKRGVSPARAARYAALAVMAAGFLAFRFTVAGAGEQARVIFGWSPSATYPNIIRLVPYYLGELLHPVNLCPDFKKFRLVSGYAHPDVIATLILFPAAGAAAAAARRRAPEITFGFFLFVLALAPVMQLVPLGTFCADRYLYLPSAGFIVVCVGLLARLCGLGKSANRTGAAFFFAITAAAAVMWGSLTPVRNSLWKDQETLYRHMTECAPMSDYAHNKLGIVLADKGDFSGALIHLERALQIMPSNRTVMLNLATVHAKTGGFDRADRFYTMAYMKDPSDPYPMYLAGLARERAGRLASAASAFQLFLKDAPDNTDAGVRLKFLLKTLEKENNSGTAP